MLCSILGYYKTVEVGIDFTEVLEVFLKEVTLKLSPEVEKLVKQRRWDMGGEGWGIPGFLATLHEFAIDDQ